MIGAVIRNHQKGLHISYVEYFPGAAKSYFLSAAKSCNQSGNDRWNLGEAYILPLIASRVSLVHYTSAQLTIRIFHLHMHIFDHAFQ